MTKDSVPQQWRYLKPAVKAKNREAESSGLSRRTACCRSWKMPTSSHQTVSHLMEVWLTLLPFSKNNSNLEESVRRLSELNYSVLIGAQEEPVESRPRRRWVLDPPEDLLRLLETAEVNRASSTFLIKRGGSFLNWNAAQLTCLRLCKSRFPSDRHVDMTGSFLC